MLALTRIWFPAYIQKMINGDSHCPEDSRIVLIKKPGD